MVNLFKINPKLLHLVKITLIMFFVALTSLIIAQSFTKIDFTYDSLSFSLQSKFSPKGGTLITIPPLGEVYLKSHNTPWQFIFTLKEIDFLKVEKQFASWETTKSWTILLKKVIKNAFVNFFMLALITGLLGGIIALLIFRIYPNSRKFWLGSFIAVTTICMLFGHSMYTFNTNSVNNPIYKGSLSSAPWILNLISLSIDNIEIIGENLRNVSNILPKLYKQAGYISSLGSVAKDLRVLHISDIHNNPAAFEFISELVADFQIDLIIDTGDITDYGTTLEAGILPKIAEIKIPYIFIPGNHDSPTIIKTLKKIKNVQVIEKGIIKVAGLTIAGIADPTSSEHSPEIASTEEYFNYYELLDNEITRSDINPDIVAVHNLFLANGFIGRTPLILHGHTHKYRFSKKGDTFINDAGTTGASGFRGLKKPFPYSAAIIYWQKNEDGGFTPNALDSIIINSIQGELTIERHVFSSKD